jgi:hypothetical protein
MTALTAVSPTLLADTVADAERILAAADRADIHNHTDMVASQAALTVALRRVLWVLEAGAGS